MTRNRGHLISGVSRPWGGYSSTFVRRCTHRKQFRVTWFAGLPLEQVGSMCPNHRSGACHSTRGGNPVLITHNQCQRTPPQKRSHAGIQARRWGVGNRYWAGSEPQGALGGCRNSNASSRLKREQAMASVILSTPQTACWSRSETRREQQTRTPCWIISTS